MFLFHHKQNNSKLMRYLWGLNQFYNFCGLKQLLTSFYKENFHGFAQRVTSFPNIDKLLFLKKTKVWLRDPYNRDSEGAPS
jgi:hypothetical protein